MTAPTSQPLSSQSELASLSERMGALQALRLTMVGVVVLATAVAPKVTGAPPHSLVPIAAVYAAVEVSGELVRRVIGGRGLEILGLMLLIDAGFVTAALYRTGGPGSYLSFLVSLHLIAVSLLVSYRTGLKLALWYTLLFGIGHYLHAAGVLTIDRLGVPVVAGFGRTEIFGILAFWLVAAATAVFSSLNERELRRSKVHLRALASMSAALTEDLHPERVAPLLLDSLITTFGMARGAVVVSTDTGVLATTMVGRQVAAESSGPWRWPDPVAQSALTTRAPVLVRRLSPANSVLARALPDAERVIVLPLLAGRTELGVVAVEQHGRAMGVPARTLEMLMQFCAHAALALRNAGLHAEVERLATFDPLTGLGNRRVFEEALEREVARASRLAVPLALVLVDVDHFKAVNDGSGHQAGDEVLRRVGAAVASVARASDVAARFGGEEFVILLPDCDEARAIGVAERVRAAIASCGGPVPVTASAGVAVGRWPFLSRDGLVRVADEALYSSKRAGRDRATLGRAAEEATPRRRGAPLRAARR